MIPYFHLPIFHLGPLTIHTWGFIVSIGFLVALYIAYRRARRVGLDGNAILDLTFWIIVGAFVGARLFHVFLYDWAYYSVHLSEILRIDQGGLSSFGGFIGSAITFLVYGKIRGLNLWRYADVLMFCWPLGHGIGRIGCFLVHMHPGRLSTVPWAVQYPSGARLDMGLIESVVLLVYWIVMVLATRGKQRFDGWYVMAGILFYGMIRFVFDFFRATDITMSDIRYFGLTPAQYGSIALVVGGIYLLLRSQKARQE